MEDDTRIFLESINLWGKYEAEEEQETQQRVFLPITFVTNLGITNDNQIAKEPPCE